jgi:hypothetical protein
MKQLCIFLMLFGLPISASAAEGGRSLTTTETDAVIQAVEDEIYVGGGAGEFYQIGENIGTPQLWKSRMHIYINPEYGGEFEGNEGAGELIYKFMPHGEIIRFFHLRKGQVQLIGNPQNSFPMTQPSHRTVFDDDEEICRLKRTWLKRFFVVEVSPAPEMIREAARRQKVRSELFEPEKQNHQN